MKKVIAVALVAYGLGAFGTGLVNFIRLRESMGMASVMQESFLSGLLWPANLVSWIV